MTRKLRVIDLKALAKESEKRLVFSDAPDVDAAELLCFAAGTDRQQLVLNPVRSIEEEKLQLFDSLIEKRATGYPLQYILGEWDFYGFTFFVNEGVLIPRPETEQLADDACAFLKGQRNKIVFDLCSGSGCIGLSVAANNPESTVYLFDVSPEALECSERNRKKLGLANVKILSYDIFKGFEQADLPTPDVILSNPPYVTREEFETLEKEIFFEPENAIVCEGDGLDFYRCIAEKWLPCLNGNGFFMLESGEGQPEKIIEIINKTPSVNKEELLYKSVDDMYGVTRFVSGRRL